MNALDLTSSQTCKVNDETSERVEKFVNIQTKNNALFPIPRKRIDQAGQGTAKVYNEDSKTS